MVSRFNTMTWLKRILQSILLTSMLSLQGVFADLILLSSPGALLERGGLENIFGGEKVDFPEAGVHLYQNENGILSLSLGSSENPGKTIWETIPDQTIIGSRYTRLQGDGNLVTYKGTPDNRRDAIWRSRSAQAESGDFVFGLTSDKTKVFISEGSIEDAIWAEKTTFTPPKTPSPTAAPVSSPTPSPTTVPPPSPPTVPVEFTTLLSRDGVTNILRGEQLEFGDVFLHQRSDGKLLLNLGSISDPGSTIWESDPTDDSTGERFTRIQGDGNLVTYKGVPGATDGIVWKSRSKSDPGQNYKFALTDDKKMVFITADTFENAIWVEETTFMGAPTTAPAPTPPVSPSTTLLSSDGVNVIRRGQQYEFVSAGVILHQKSNGLLTLSKDGKIIWETDPSDRTTGERYTIMQMDGNLVTYKGTPEAQEGSIWTSGSAGLTGTYKFALTADFSKVFISLNTIEDAVWVEDTSYVPPSPTSSPVATPSPTSDPTEVPTSTPLPTGTPLPTDGPTSTPLPTTGDNPTFFPTVSPTFTPTFYPTSTPTSTPLPTTNDNPTFYPTTSPTYFPTYHPTSTPTYLPTFYPTQSPSGTTAPVETMEPTDTMGPTMTLLPTDTMGPTETMGPTVTLGPTDTMGPTTTPAPTESMAPSISMSPTDSMKPSASPTPPPIQLDLLPASRRNRKLAASTGLSATTKGFKKKLDDLLNQLAQSDDQFLTHAFSFPRTLDVDNKDDITLATHVTVDKFARLLMQIESWGGPVSCAVYIQNKADASKLVRFVNSHLTELRKTQIRVFLEEESQSEYPVNHLRNLAMDNVDTDYVIAMDVDFVIDGTAYSDLKNTLRSNDGAFRKKLQEKTLFVLPAFERLMPCELDSQKPCDKRDSDRTITDEMVSLTREEVVALTETTGEVSPFHLDCFFKGHSPTNYTHWYKSDKNEFSYPISYEKHFEPYVVAYRPNLPKYWSSFRGFGFNKASWFYELDLMGYKFEVLNNHFVLHKNHYGSQCGGRGTKPKTMKEWLRFQKKMGNKYQVNLQKKRKATKNVSGVASKEANTQATKTTDGPKFIPLPQDETGVPNVPYGCGESERTIDEIQVHVLGWRRHESLVELLSQLESATYEGWDIPVPLNIHLDGGAHDDVKEAADQFQWTHGAKNIDVRTENVGLRNMWISSVGPAAREAGDNTLMLVFEDDTRVSKDYFQWLLSVIDAYGRNKDCRDSNLMGFSLSPILLNEMQRPFTPWDASTELGSRSEHLAYLSVIPSSWGVAYWSDRWNEFADFVDVRMQPSYYNVEAEDVKVESYDDLSLTPKELQIPGSRSNVWPKSWKRFMVDFMYGRGLVMLYPNLPEGRGLATTLALTGEHVSKNNKQENPRIAKLVDTLDIPSIGILPRYGDLGIFDLFHKSSTKVKLTTTGARFLQGVANKCDNCDDLVKAWARPGMSFSSFDDSSHTPLICAPDMYMSVDGAKNLHDDSANVASEDRYLLFEPQYGANNQIFGLVEALYWAKTLGRQLVVPPIFLPRVSEYETGVDADLISSMGAWPHTKEVFDINDASASSSLPTLSFQEFMKKNTTLSRILRITRDAHFDKNSHVLTSAIKQQQEINNNHEESTTADIPQVNIRHLFHNAPSAADVKHLLGGCDDQVLAFEGLFFANIRGTDKYKGMKDVVNLSDEARRILDVVEAEFKKTVGSDNYVCLHVRTGDFGDMCKNLQHIDYYRSLDNQGYQCDVETQQVNNALIRHGKPALIMSDNYAALEEELIKTTKATHNMPKTLSSDWVKETVASVLPDSTIDSSNLDLLSLAIEQELCADADISILNKFSTVSRRIANLRHNNDNRGMLYWKRHNNNNNNNNNNNQRKRKKNRKMDKQHHERQQKQQTNKNKKARKNNLSTSKEFLKTEQQ